MGEGLLGRGGAAFRSLTRTQREDYRWIQSALEGAAIQVLEGVAIGGVYIDYRSALEGVAIGFVKHGCCNHVSFRAGLIWWATS